MTAVPLFDVLARQKFGPGAVAPDLTVRLANLAAKLVTSSLADFERIRDYEQSMAWTEAEQPALRVEILRSVWQLYAQWVDEADQVVRRARSMVGGDVGGDVGGNFPAASLAPLEVAIGRTRARLTLTPEQIAGAQDQACQGQFVPAQGMHEEMEIRGLDCGAPDYLSIRSLEQLDELLVEGLDGPDAPITDQNWADIRREVWQQVAQRKSAPGSP